ncbi:MAG: ChaN family lipoprotein [Myxococcaceae bacterium]|nr:ChaN family lipoprotein [Myxococcaceae bacterium]
MRTSLSLQQTLYRSQKARIARAVENTSAAFRAYEARYRRLTRSFERAVRIADVEDAVRAADIVYVGDYHTLRSAQQSYLRLVEAALASRRRVVMALEFVEGRHQSALESFVQGRIGEKTFLSRIGHPYTGAFDIWPNFRPLFETARARGLPIIAIDSRAGGPGSLQRRDAYAAERIASIARAEDRPLVMVLMGQYHVAPCHLPRAVAERLGPGVQRRSLIVYQNCESIWWELSRRGRVGRVEAVRIRDGEYCLVHTSPLLCQQSFLDYLEAESGDAPVGDDALGDRFRQMAKLIGRFLGADVARAVDRVVQDVEVVTPADPSPLERVRARGRLTRRELEQIRRQILSRESYYIPRARTAYLASLALNHAAEEAAHFVRHCAVGDGTDAPRRASDAFYARCVEEALGFFGSRLVNPRRRCRTLGEWAELFARGRGEDRQIAAFLLAHKAAESEGPEQASKLVPLRRDRLFNGVSHGLGYLLGDALHAAFEARKVRRAELRALFQDPLEDPRAVYFAWTRRFTG